MTYENLRDDIVFKLINKEKNADFIKSVPYVDYLDLAVIFYYVVKDNDEGHLMRLITNEMCESWGVDANTLMENALNNSPRILGLKIRGILSTISSMLIEGELFSLHEDEERDLPLYVATNDNAFLGASVILYRDMLKAFAARKKSDVYIIPCSLHEVLFIPTAECPVVEVSELKNLIFYVNRNELQEEDFLSDNLYYYSFVDDELTIV
ncbi:hypothetical protein CIY_16630 [Butyrivibrio fibrisolvens 16/4]|nr:hypothetical protein CIY_16630 [Butyrivibrio fibrisolvens 16/4]